MSPNRRPREGGPAEPVSTASTGPVPLTAYEAARVLFILAPQPGPAERVRRGLAWSLWRRCHQAVALACHVRRRRRERVAREKAKAQARPPPRTTAGQRIYD